MLCKPNSHGAENESNLQAEAVYLVSLELLKGCFDLKRSSTGELFQSFNAKEQDQDWSILGKKRYLFCSTVIMSINNL